MRRSLLMSATCLFVLASVSGCDHTDVAVGHFAALPETEAYVAFAEDKARATRRIGYFDSRQYEELRQHDSKDLIAESVFAMVHPRRENYVLDLDPLVADTVSMWTVHAGREISYGESVRAKNDFADFWIRPFVRDAERNTCIGYVGGWTREPRDPAMRPKELLFGYACRFGDPFTTEDIDRYVNEISLVERKTIPLHIDGGVTGIWRSNPVEPDALTDGTDIGLDGFPLRSARRFIQEVPKSGE